MSSPKFNATSPGDCALSGKKFAKGAEVFYLTCLGSQKPLPAEQIQRSTKAEGYSTGFRTVPDGTITVGKGRFTRTKPKFVWEQQVAGGRWIKVAVWENLVLVEEARAMGFKVPGSETVAQKGKRTVGYAHSLDRESVRNVPYTDLMAPKTAPIGEPIATKPEGVREVDLEPVMVGVEPVNAVAPETARILDLD